MWRGGNYGKNSRVKKGVHCIGLGAEGKGCLGCKLNCTLCAQGTASKAQTLLHLAFLNRSTKWVPRTTSIVFWYVMYACFGIGPSETFVQSVQSSACLLKQSIGPQSGEFFLDPGPKSTRLNSSDLGSKAKSGYLRCRHIALL